MTISGVGGVPGMVNWRVAKELEASVTEPVTLATYVPGGRLAMLMA
jgi:hypothetical protein